MTRGPSATAVHEAAHAVVAYILGYKVLEIVVLPDKSGYCRILFRSPWKNECPITATNILIAGHEAEVLWRGRKLTSMPASDLKMLQRLGVSWTGINIQRDKLRKFLRNWKRTIFTVAVMVDKGPVSGRKFRAYMRTRLDAVPKPPKMCR